MYTEIQLHLLYSFQDEDFGHLFRKFSLSVTKVTNKNDGLVVQNYRRR